MWFEEIVAGGKGARGDRSMQVTARHAGHADIIREQIDGVTGR